MTIQQIIETLNAFWSKQGALIAQPYGIEVGAGTANPMTFLRVLGPEPFNVAYVEPSRRPADGRYGLSPNRFQHYFQYQVILKPAPAFNQELYLGLLKQLGIDNTKHDLRFVEDNWESQPIGAWGLGWEVWCDGMEITQYTYFQQVAGIPLEVPALEITFGLERMAMYIQGVDDYHKLKWNDDLMVSDLFEKHEYWQSKHNYETANIDHAQERFTLYRSEVESHLTQGNYWVAYDYLLKMSHTFNILDARGVVSVSDRVARFGQMSKYANQIGKLYLEERKKLKYPFLKKIKPVTYELPAVKSEIRNSKFERNTYVLEIGLEELPAEFMKKWVKALSPKDEYGNTSSWLKMQLAEKQWKYDDAQLWFTPRRIVVQITKPDLTRKETITVKGPLYDIAYTNGQATKVLEGFLAKNMATEKDVKVIEQGGRKFVTIEKKVETTFETIIQSIVDDLIKTAPATKYMRWDQNPKHVFIRPVRWILSYHNNKVIPVTVFDVTPSGFTMPPRFEEIMKVDIRSAQEYLAYAKKNLVLDQQKRLHKIEDEIPVKKLNDDPVVLENVYLTEYPTVGHLPIAKKYRELPDAVIRSILEKNQRYIVFPTEYFIPSNARIVSKTILEGNAAVAKARLEDGLFYLQADRKRKLVDWQDDLKKIVFHPKAGSYFDKIIRLEKLLAGSKNYVPYTFKVNQKLLKESLSLLKNDRATNLGKEFPNLEGIIGAHYARLEKYHSTIQKVIQEHYLPRGDKPVVPSIKEALLMSLLDKVDTITTLSAVEDLPDGSHDPYQIRQRVYEILTLFSLCEKKLVPFDFWPLLEQSWHQVNEQFQSKTSLPELKQFIQEKMYQNYRKIADEDWLAKALAYSEHGYFARKGIVLKEIQYKKDQSTTSIFDSLKRIHNIMKQLKSDNSISLDGEIDQLLVDPKEQKLFQFINKPVSVLKVDILQDLFFILELFFKEVMVMDKNTQVRQNRGRIMKKLQDLLNYNLSYQP